MKVASRVLDAVIMGGCETSIQVASHTGIRLSLVSDFLHKLVAANKLSRTLGGKEERRGRRTYRYALPRKSL